jgi:predicted HicB family RNase H-like nuclease
MEMTLQVLLETFEHKINDGAEYLWPCFPDARFLNFSSEFAHVSVVHSTTDQTVYQVEVSANPDSWDEDQPAFRWTNPNFLQVFLDECKNRGIDSHVAWDEIKYTDVEDVEMFLSFAEDMFEGIPYEGKTKIKVELPDRILLKLALAAHEKDITLNEYVNYVFKQELDRMETQ